jgi:apolipoprotein N-acyltransferase
MHHDFLERAPWPALLAAATGSGLAFYFSTAGNTVALLAWLAPVPILAFVFAHGAASRAGRRAPGIPWRTVTAALVAAAAGNLAWVVLYHGVFPAGALAGLLTLLAVTFGAAVLVTSVAAARLGSLAATLLFPAFCVSAELAITRLSPHGSAGSLAYSQAGFLALAQLASWTGLSGITFVVSFVAAGLAAFAGDCSRRWRFELLVAPVLLVCFVFELGQWRLASAQAAGQARVGLASVDAAMKLSSTARRDEALGVLSRYLTAAGALAARHADVVILPEKIIGVAPDYADEVSSRLSAEAERGGIILVAGLNEIDGDARRNVAAVYAHGRRVLAYEKQHLVPGFEDRYRRGASPGVYQAPGGVVGVAICKDMDFPDLGRPYSAAGVGLLLVPAWDFVRDAELHSRMAIMRGIEGGFSVARSAADGLLRVSDFRGEVLAERDSSEAPLTTLLADVPLGRGRTFYGRYGDWFAWLNVCAALGIVVSACTRLKHGPVA